MNIKEQVKIMETQLSSFDDLTEKLYYLTEFFGKDPEFTQEARNIVRSNICKALKVG